jgi:hypothetical protein
MKRYRPAQKFIRIIACALFAWAGFYSCGTYGLTYENGKSWPHKPVNAERLRGTLQMGRVEVDKPAGSYSVEREISSILPLVFWELGYVFEPPSGKADYIVDVYARERDVTHGWKTKKSISLEVVLWPVQQVNYALPEGIQTPYAAGRSVLVGTAGLLVSGNTEKLLKKTAKKAVGAAARVRKYEAKYGSE